MRGSRYGAGAGMRIHHQEMHRVRTDIEHSETHAMTLSRRGSLEVIGDETLLVALDRRTFRPMTDRRKTQIEVLFERTPAVRETGRAA